MCTRSGSRGVQDVFAEVWIEADELAQCPHVCLGETALVG